MDVARHGIFSPQYFSFYEVMCIFLGVMVTDVILLDIFNTFGIDSYVEWQKAGGGDVNTFSMEALQQTAHTPILFLLIAGTIMVLSLIFSKKAKNVVKTSVDLSSQSDGEEMSSTPTETPQMDSSPRRYELKPDSDLQ